MADRHLSMHGRRHASMLVTLAMGLAIGLAACGGSSEPGPLLGVDANGATTVDPGNLGRSCRPTRWRRCLRPRRGAWPSCARKSSLRTMCMRSVPRSGNPVFANIGASEATHSAAVKALLDRYQLPDPLVGLSNGNFKTTAFQSLYATLVASSRGSLVDALKVGAQIEELDLRDITVQKAGTDNADILMVYDRLLQGSRNHLRAFMRSLTQQGGSYVPRYISQQEFDAIVNSPFENGP